jgi:hypothetical protein
VIVDGFISRADKAKAVYAKLCINRLAVFHKFGFPYHRFPTGSGIPTNVVPNLAQGILCRSSYSISEVGFIENRLKDRLQPIQKRLLAYPVIDRWNA